MNTMTEDGPLTPGAVMARLNVTRQALLRWEAAGTLIPFKLPSGHRRYRREDVEAIERGEASA